MACNTCRQMRSDLVRAMRRGDVNGAVKAAAKGLGHMAGKLRPPPKTARLLVKRR